VAKRLYHSSPAGEALLDVAEFNIQASPESGSRVSENSASRRCSMRRRAYGVAAVTMVSPVGGLIAAAATYDDRQGPIDLTPISEAEAKQAIAAAQ
jgi:hypothetical protein